MIFTLSILINLALIFAVWRLSLRRAATYVQKFWYVDKKQCAKIEKALLKASISEKFAERAFNLASTANLTCMHLSRTLATRPAWVTKHQMLKNEIAQNAIKEAIGGPTGEKDMSDFDFLYTVLGDEERDIVDKAVEHNAKYSESLSTPETKWPESPQTTAPRSMT
jgi:hypothetical protein